MNLKKIERVFTSRFVGTGPSSYLKKKKNLPGRGLTKVEKHCTRGLDWTYRMSRLPFAQYAREFRTLRDAGGFVVLKMCVSTNTFENF